VSDQKLITLVIGVITSLVAGWLGYDNTASVTAERMQGRVIAVSDGDTLTLLVGVQEHRIRLGGVDAP
jgi:endonuclease YncB( thermonuclease family)